MKHHLTYHISEFPEPVLEVTREFFDSNPWAGSHQQRLVKFQAWYSACCEAMGYDDSLIVIVRSIDDLLSVHPSQRPVGLRGLAVIDLFHAFRHEMVRMGHQPKSEDRCDDGRDWAYSLYYNLRTDTFCKAVRKGLIPGVTELDLIPADDVGCALPAAQRAVFEDLAERFVDSLGEEDHDLMDLMAQFSGE